MKRILATLSLLSIFSLNAIGQMIKDPTDWSFSAKKKDAKHFTILIHTGIMQPWHMYALQPGGDGTLIPTSVKFNAAEGIMLKGALREISKSVTETMEGVDGKVNLYTGKADFAQDVTASAGKIISGTVEYQTCSDKMCLPPKKKTFSITLR